MKRSDINQIISEASDFFTGNRFMLPVWASWSPSDWKGKSETCREIVENGLGWDITDFGRGDFATTGLTLFTIRNGNPAKMDKLYCEKIMISGEEQETPLHFHWHKTEDIINRGGGDLVMELWNSTSGEGLASDPVTVSVDGISTVVKAGESLILKPGQSICLKSGVYHRFYGRKGTGKVLIGEVSLVNDDARDNRFLEQTGRFPAIEEDVPPVRLMVNDYMKYL
ncbi:MAG: D-lyxose/D-mannose family sugar isomerase [Bacteroidales bacterium]|jgi:D-lyxose ketol-isomerase|nr:D-lyxose/D-mannose family sugar isomerase [Bacteroidales bacterium]